MTGYLTLLSRQLDMKEKIPYINDSMVTVLLSFIRYPNAIVQLLICSLTGRLNLRVMAVTSLVVS